MSFEITFFGTNKHNFGSDGLGYITTPIAVNASKNIAHLSEDLNAVPVVHTFYNSREVANFLVPNGGSIGGNSHGKAKVTIAQTSDFVGRKLYLQYFKWLGNKWQKSGNHNEFDGDALQNSDVTVQAGGTGVV